MNLPNEGKKPDTKEHVLYEVQRQARSSSSVSGPGSCYLEEERGRLVGRVRRTSEGLAMSCVLSRDVAALCDNLVGCVFLHVYDTLILKR